MIGKTISHYKIIEKLGEGGMGVVYKAQDLKLDRFVALKFLPPHLGTKAEEKERFIHEAKAASALQHNNVCTIFEIDETDDGQMFICMDYYEGETLNERIKSGPLKIDEALNTAIQIAQGLEKAHKKAIVHRDIKPGNILVTEDGVVKILDFGLAKLAGKTKLTKAQTTLGTVAYMSPEQSEAEDVDHRTDIWSLGVVLYEMVTGQRPFRGDYDQAMVYSILNEDSEPMTALRTGVPMELERIVNKALAKNPDERYQHVDEMLVDLYKVKPEFKQEVIYSKKLKQTGTLKRHTMKFAIPGIFLLIVIVIVAGYFLIRGKEKLEQHADETITDVKWESSIAVLPFVDMSPQKDQEHFSDGMAETLINALSNIRELRVVARTSAFSFKGKEQDIREIGKKLNVETILEGSVQKAGNDLRITVQLIKVEDGYYIWSNQYDCELKDVFSIQDEISLTIVDKLKVKLLGGERERLVKRYTENLEAYNLCLKARYFLNQRTEEGFNKALEYFKQAIGIDPNYATAYAGLAHTYNLIYYYGYLPIDETLKKAREASSKAIELDDSLGEAHTSLALCREIEGDFAASEEECKRAIELNPSSAEAHHRYGYTLTFLGRHEEAIKEAKIAQGLEPTSSIMYRGLGFVYYWARQYDRALEECQKALELNPNSVLGYEYIFWVYQRKKMYIEAITALEKYLILKEFGDLAELIKQTYEKSGFREAIRRLMDASMKQTIPGISRPYFHRARYFAIIGDKDQAFLWLEKQRLEDDFKWSITVKTNPNFDSLRTDPRYTEFLKKEGLEK